MRLLHPDQEDFQDAAVEFVLSRMPAIDGGQCARCDTALVEGEIPSGSRVTDCRCIPVCTLCGEIEALHDMVLDLVEAIYDSASDQDEHTYDVFMDQVARPKVEVLWPLTAGVTHWPVSRAEQEAGLTGLEGQVHIEEGTLASSDDGEQFLLTESGVSRVKMRESPGGWLEHRFDDSEDRAERER